MKLTFKKSDILKAVQLSQGIVSSNISLPILSCVVIETKDNSACLTVSDLEIYSRVKFPAEVKEEGTVAISAKRFFGIMKELASDSVEIDSLENSGVAIKSGKSRFKIHGLPSEDFPSMPVIEGLKTVKVKQDLLSSLLHKVISSASQDSGRSTLNGILLDINGEIVTCVATDGRRLSLAKGELLGSSEELDIQTILPLKVANELLKILSDGEIEIGITLNQIIFKTDDYEMIARQIEGKFPSYQQVIPADSPVKINLPRSEFLSAVRRVALMTSDQSPSIKLSFEEGKVNISSVTPEIGEGNEDVNLDYKGDNIEIAFNPNFVNDIFRGLDNETVDFGMKDSGSPGVFKAGEFLGIIMPIKLA